MSDEIRQDGFEEQSEVPADVQDAAPAEQAQAEASALSPQPRKASGARLTSGSALQGAVPTTARR